MLKKIRNLIRLEAWQPGAVKLLCKFIPVKKWRRALRDKYVPKRKFPGTSPQFYEIKHKQQILMANPDNAHLVFLGSSHVAYGFNPAFCDAHAYNMGSTSQDLRTTCGVLSKILPTCHNLRHVFVGIDVFSRGWNLTKTSVAYLCTFYNYLYGVEYVPNNCDAELLQHCKKMDRKKKKPDYNENGYLRPTFEFPEKDPKKRMAGHMREHNRDESQYKWIEKIAEMLAARNIALTLCLMPARKDYRKEAPNSNELFADLKALVQEPRGGGVIRIINFYDDPDFTDDDFCDYDHLNPRGAEKLSRKVKECFDN